MFKCYDCGREFEEFNTHFETHGLPTGPFEKLDTCPFCGSTNFHEVSEPEPYDPDLAEISKKIVESLFYINTFSYQLEDIFGKKIENAEFEKAWESLVEALHIISAPEGMDRSVENIVTTAKLTDSSLNSAIINFLEGAKLNE